MVEKRAWRHSESKIIFTRFEVISETLKVCDIIPPYTEFQKFTNNAWNPNHSSVLSNSVFRKILKHLCVSPRQVLLPCSYVYRTTLSHVYRTGTIPVTMRYDNSNYVLKYIFSVKHVNNLRNLFIFYSFTPIGNICRHSRSTPICEFSWHWLVQSRCNLGCAVKQISKLKSRNCAFTYKTYFITQNTKFEVNISNTFWD